MRSGCCSGRQARRYSAFHCITRGRPERARGEGTANGPVLVVLKGAGGDAGGDGRGRHDPGSGNAASDNSRRTGTDFVLRVGNTDIERARRECCPDGIGRALLEPRLLAKCVFGAYRQRPEHTGVKQVVVETAAGGNARAGGRENARVFVVEWIVSADDAKCHGILMAQIQRAPCAAKAHGGGTVEEARRVANGAGTSVETGFEVKMGIHSAAQIFDATKADAIGIVGTGRAHSGTTLAGGVHAVNGANTAVERTVYCFCRLGMSQAGERTENGQCRKRFFILISEFLIVNFINCASWNPSIPSSWVLSRCGSTHRLIRKCTLRHLLTDPVLPLRGSIISSISLSNEFNTQTHPVEALF